MATCWPEHKNCLHRQYIGRKVTLDGHPAEVIADSVGRAWVTHTGRLHENLIYVPFSWTATYNVCDLHEGRFRTHG